MVKSGASAKGLLTVELYNTDSFNNDSGKVFTLKLYFILPLMPDITISLIQADLRWENKKENLELFESRIAELKGKTQIALLPEMFSTGFSMNPAALAETMEGKTVQWMKKVSAENRLVLIGSVIIREHNQEENKEEFFNRLIAMLPNGTFAVYDKRHRFAYAGEDENYSAGKKRLIISVNGWRINLLICYDLRFPVWSRQQVSNNGQKAESLPEYDLLVYVANWPEKRIHAWKSLLQARAIENQCYVAGVNRVGQDGNGIIYNGNSLVVDPLGEVLYTGQNVEDIFTITLGSNSLQDARTRFPFWKDADRFRIDVE
jgi:omega-amidase